MRERLFLVMAWMPKATVQAALGGVALDIVRSRGDGSGSGSGDGSGQAADLERATLVLTLAVLAILVTAPIGAVLIAQMGPRLLDRDPSFGSKDGSNSSGLGGARGSALGPALSNSGSGYTTSGSGDDRTVERHGDRGPLAPVVGPTGSVQDADADFVTAESGSLYSYYSDAEEAPQSQVGPGASQTGRPDLARAFARASPA
jgi:hypothetical protein